MFFQSSFVYADLWLILIGLITGLSGSVLGGNGGFIILPVLTVFFNVPAHIAISTSLAATIPACITTGIYHYRSHSMNIKLGAVFAITGILGAFAGSALTGILNQRQIKAGFGIYSIVMALIMLYNFKLKKRQKLTFLKAKYPQLPKGTMYGFLSGLITGTFGTSGSAPVMAALFLYRMPVQIVIGTSVLIILSNTFFALASHLILGAIDLTLILFLTAGSVLGAVLGYKYFDRKKVVLERRIKMGYVWVMAATGILMILTS